MSDELRHAIAEQVIGLDPDGNKTTWGKAFLELAEQYGMSDFGDWKNAQLISICGTQVGRVKTAIERKQKNARLLERGVAVGTGLNVNPTISVRTKDGARQLMLWTKATPAQFLAAVFREQAIVDGRAESNAIRMQLAERLRKDELLMELPTLGDVCAALEIDADILGLDELEEGAA